jgi:hypothetical protein
MNTPAEYLETEEIEFPSILKDGNYYTLDLTRIVERPVYVKCFIKNELSHALTYNETSKEYLCHAELWIMRNNPKYDHLWKKEK